MSALLGNGIAVLLVAGLVWISAREIWKGHQSGGCGGCSGDCGSCSSSCHSGGTPQNGAAGKAPDLSGKKFAVNGKIVRLDEMSGNRGK